MKHTAGRDMPGKRRLVLFIPAGTIPIIAMAVNAFAEDWKTRRLVFPVLSLWYLVLCKESTELAKILIDI